VRRLAYLAFYRQIGGAEMCLLTLLEGLDRGRFAPLVVLSGPGPLAAAIAERGVPVVFEPGMRYLVRGAASPSRVVASLRQFVSVEHSLLRLIRAEGIDLVHAFVTPALKYGGLAAKLAGIPAVGTLHDVLAPPFSWLRRKVIVTNINRLYDRLIVPSRASLAVLLRSGADPVKVTVIPNGVDLERLAPDPAAAARLRADLGLPADAPVVGMVGRFARLKGHDVLLRAIGEVARHDAGVRCLVVGDAVFEGEQEWKREMIALTRRLGLEGRVVFTGWRADVPALLATLDVFVQPSVAPDSFPTAVLEAMAAGRPVVAGDTGGTAEIVEDGVTGCLLPAGDAPRFADAILRLCADRAGSRRMGAAGRARAAREFSRERHCRAIEGLYDAVPGPARRPSPVD
jgi:glycosyltransferase involved in cell wall biosynthesis